MQVIVVFFAGIVAIGDTDDVVAGVGEELGLGVGIGAGVGVPIIGALI